MTRKEIWKKRTDSYFIFFWIFVISCFLGTLIETIFHLFVYGEFQNRAGVLYGPFNPIYGFGSILMTYSLRKIQHNSLLLIFICSTCIGLAFEYVCSLFQEIIFNSISWSYDNTYLSINGRTNIIFGFFWGILGCLWIKMLYPFFLRQLEKVKNPFTKFISLFFAVFMFCNLLLSFLAVYRQSKRIQNIPAKNQLDLFLDTHYPDNLLKKIYPEMIFLEE